MNTEEKSLKLAELMGWNVVPTDHGEYEILVTNNGNYYGRLNPYYDSPPSLAQFAAILLRFPEVMMRICYIGDGAGGRAPENRHIMMENFDATQSNILDEILRMNGVEI